MSEHGDLYHLRYAAESRVAFTEAMGRGRAGWNPMRYVWMFLWWRSCRWADYLERLCHEELVAAAFQKQDSAR